MDRFYVEMSILTVKRIYNYNIGLFMYKYVNKMTPGVFDNFFRNISDIHQHNTINTTQKQFYITYRGTTRGHKQRVLMHRHQGLNVQHGLCHIYMRYLYIYELFIAFVCFVVCSLL